MTTVSTNPLAAATMANQPARLTLHATRYECRHCHAHTFLVLRTIGEAKCSVCESRDLARVED
jgi:hypothetical protein